jgi:hypothetical protein
MQRARLLALSLILISSSLVGLRHGESTAVAARADAELQPFDLFARDGSGPYGYVKVANGPGDLVVIVHLTGARTPGMMYGVSACRAEADGSLACLPTGTPLGVRTCQTQAPNTGIVYCGWVDGNGDWFSTGVLQRFVFPDLPFEANLILIWNVNAGMDYYRADLMPDLPRVLQSAPTKPQPEPDDA